MWMHFLLHSTFFPNIFLVTAEPLLQVCSPPPCLCLMPVQLISCFTVSSLHRPSCTSTGVPPREAVQRLSAESGGGWGRMHRKLEKGWGGVNKGSQAAFTAFPRQPVSQSAREQQQPADWKVLPGICLAPPPTIICPSVPPLHQQTANLNAGAGTQVYKQQTVGPHQRLSLKDNGCSPPPHLPCLPAPSTQRPSPRGLERCPLLPAEELRRNPVGCYITCGTLE